MDPTPGDPLVEDHTALCLFSSSSELFSRQTLDFKGFLNGLAIVVNELENV